MATSLLYLEALSALLRDLAVTTPLVLCVAALAVAMAGVRGSASWPSCMKTILCTCWPCER